MVDLMSLLTVGGLSVVLLAIVQFLKTNLPDNRKLYIPWLAVLLGILLALGIGVATGAATSSNLAQWFVTGLLAGLGSSGLYQATLQIAKSTPPPAVPPPSNGTPH